MPKVRIDFTRTRSTVEVGSAEIDIADDAAATLRQGRNMEAWATFTMINAVTNWSELPKPNPKLDIVARIDGKVVPLAPPAAAPRRKPMEPRERAARALCRRDGHPENTKFEGKPMWQSYLDIVDIVLAEAKPSA